MPFPSLLQRLKERKFVQWAVAYLAGAWVLYEVTATVGGAWNLPNAFLQGLFIVLAIGFFVTLVLAWYHGEKGRQRVSGPELLMVAALSVVAGVALSTLGNGRGTAANSPLREEDNRPGIAVLLCENLSTNPEDEYLASSLHFEILLKLQGISSLLPVGRASVEWYGDHPAPLTQVASELGVGFVGDCSVQKYEDQIRLIFQLLDGRTGGLVWANEYERDLTVGNLFSIQGDIAHQVASAIGALLTPEEEERLTTLPTQNEEAYAYYLRGLEYWQRSYDETDRRIAAEMFENATRLDPAFALAFARLSEAHSGLFWFHFDRSQDRLRREQEAIDRALELGPNLPETQQALGYYHYHRLNYGRALEHFTTALVRQPGNSDLLAAMGYVERRRGNPRVALTHLKKALELDPLAAIRHQDLAETYGELLRDYPAAEFHLIRTIALAPDLVEPHGDKAWLYVCWKGDLSKAREVLEAAGDLGLADIGNPWWVGYRWVLVDFFSGDHEAALDRLSSRPVAAFTDQFVYVPKALLEAKINQSAGNPGIAAQQYESAVVLLEDLIRETPEDSRLHGALGIAYAGLGRTDEALREGELGLSLLPVSEEAWRGLFRVEEMAEILTKIGRLDAAVDRLEYLLERPGDMSVPRLNLDPTWDPLRTHPRFKALLEKYADDVEH